MALPRRVVLGLLAMTDIGVHGRGGMVSARDMAERHGMPPRHFETVLQDLTRAGLVRGHRGPRGGYQFARERQRISAADVVRAVGLTDPLDTLSGSDVAHRIVAPVIDAVERALFVALETLMIEQLVERADIPTSADGGNFTI